MSMEIFGPPISPDVSDDQRASDALIKLVRKLRWMGMNDEMERVEQTLTARDTRPADIVIGGPSETA
jgi:hypothetical protein